MDNEEYQSIYKYLILLNANKKGWSIYKKDNNVFYLYKKKSRNEFFNLKYEIDTLNKSHYDIEKIINKINKK